MILDRKNCIKFGLQKTRFRPPLKTVRVCQFRAYDNILYYSFQETSAEEAYIRSHYYCGRSFCIFQLVPLALMVKSGGVFPPFQRFLDQTFA